MIGQRFGRWEVVAKAENRNKKKRWLCKCDCGNEAIVIQDGLKRGASKSCGCLARELVSQRFYKHGLSAHPIHGVWSAMKCRCSNPNYKEYHLYGGRGISVCEHWDSFDNFINDMGLPPFKSAQLDRIDSNGNYEPKNCRWVSPAANSRNRRNNVRFEYEGKSLTIPEWAEKYGLNQGTLWGRLRVLKWPIDQALTRGVAA